MLITLLLITCAAVTLFTYGVLPQSGPPAFAFGRRRAVAPLEGRQAGIRLLKALMPVVNRLAPTADLVRWLPLRAWVSRSIKRAGIKHALTVNQVFAGSALLGVSTPLFALLVGGFRQPVVLTSLTVVGAALPALLLRDLWRQRERQIVRGLPGTVDVLSLSVHAGLEFLVAVRRVVERGEPGPLRDELATVLQDIRLGQTRAEALKGLATRVQAREVREFCSVLIQADLLGASVATTLASLASRMRTERFQRAEKAGAKAAQKLRLPMMAFIFPAVLLLIIAIAIGPMLSDIGTPGGLR